MTAPTEGATFFPEPVGSGAPPVGSGAPWSDSDLTAADRRMACAATPTDSSDAGALSTAAPRDPSEAGARGGDGAPLTGHPRADAPTDDTATQEALAPVVPDRRVLDPEATAFVDPVRTNDGAPKQWRVRTGDTSVTFSSGADADDCAWLHNYMHGHLLIFPTGLEVPLPADRRTPPASDDVSALDPAQTDDVFDAIVHVAVNALDCASRLEEGRNGRYRTVELHRLAREVEKVSNS